MEAKKRIKRIKRTSSAGAAKSEFNINDLDDDSLGLIFNKLRYHRDRVGIESVCKRWRDVSKANWGTYSKHLNVRSEFPFCIPDYERNKKMLKRILERQGCYFEEITLSDEIECTTFFAPGIVKRIVKCCPKLKCLNVRSQVLNSEDWLACSNIEGLSLSRRTYSANLRELFRRNKRLRRLKLYNTAINASDFEHLNPGQLEILHLTCCLDLKLARLVDKLAESLVELKYTTNALTYNMDDLHHISKLKNLRSLFVRFITGKLLETQFIVDIAKNCQKLERISLCSHVGDKFNLNFIPLLFNMPCLKSVILILNKYEMTYEELDRLFRKAASLKFFVLSSCTDCKYEKGNVKTCDYCKGRRRSPEAVIMTAS